MPFRPIQKTGAQVKCSEEFQSSLDRTVDPTRPGGLKRCRRGVLRALRAAKSPRAGGLKTKQVHAIQASLVCLRVPDVSDDDGKAPRDDEEGPEESKDGGGEGSK